MHKATSLLLLLSVLCLLNTWVVTAQNAESTYKNPYQYSDSNEKTENTNMNNYGHSYNNEKTENTNMNNYGHSDNSMMSENTGYYAPPNYGDNESTEEQYSDYNKEEYTYSNGNYGGSDTGSYGQGSSYSKGSSSGSSSSYSSSQGYTGQYDSSSSTSVPKFPSSLLTGFVVDIHFLAVDIHFQYIAYHYCSDLYPGYTQCAIYNGTDSNSRLVATEIVVSESIFQTLPMSERKLWHSHAFAVKNGLLVLPGVPASQAEATYKGVMTTYGKVVDYFHSFQDFPLGPPRLAYGLAAANQINETIADELDKSLMLTDTWRQRQQERAGWAMPTIIEGADDYLTSGYYPQYVEQQFKL